MVDHARMLLFGIVVAIATVDCHSQDTVEADPDDIADSESFELWHSTLSDAIAQATELNKPIFVIVGADWCVYCKKLESELDGPASKAFAKRWVLAKIDADDQISDAREMRANGLPSLRLLSKNGVINDSHDGYMTRGAVSKWLDQNYDAIQSNVPKLLEIDPAEFTDEQIGQLIQFVSTKDVTIRRIVVDRLSKVPNRCAIATIELLLSKRLANQLSALEILRRWDAPVDGLDPWIPGAIDEKAVTRLRDWCAATYPNSDTVASGDQ